MANNGLITISKEIWTTMPVEQREGALYDVIVYLQRKVAKLEKFSYLKLACVFTGSACGGAMMILVIRLLDIKPF